MTTVDKDGFTTETEREYKWPYPVPLEEKTGPPPVVTKPKNFYAAKADPCACFAHQGQPPTRATYNDLMEREKDLCHKLINLRKDLDQISPEDIEDREKQVLTSYQIDYDNERGEGDFADTSNFRTIAFGEFESKDGPTASSDATPKSIDDWFRSSTGRTEYQDTISRNGQSLMQNRQLYLEPRVSSKRPPADTSFF